MATPYKRFPVPEFDRDALKGMSWETPKLLDAAAAAQLIEARRRGDQASVGCYPIAASEALFDRFKIRGEHRHALLCILPDRKVTVLGRSFAWKIQRAWLVDPLAAEGSDLVAEWTTTRPMNTRLGPENGIAIGNKALYALCGNRYGDHWIGNRTLVQGDWRAPGASGGFAILAASEPKANNFHDCNLYFSW